MEGHTVALVDDCDGQSIEEIEQQVFAEHARLEASIAKVWEEGQGLKMEADWLVSVRSGKQRLLQAIQAKCHSLEGELQEAQATQREEEEKRKVCGCEHDGSLQTLLQYNYNHTTGPKSTRTNQDSSNDNSNNSDSDGNEKETHLRARTNFPEEVELKQNEDDSSSPGFRVVEQRHKEVQEMWMGMGLSLRQRQILDTTTAIAKLKEQVAELTSQLLPPHTVTSLVDEEANLSSIMKNFLE